MKSYIGLIYFMICFIRAAILFCTSLFPTWTFLVWIFIPLAVPIITAFIEDKKMSDEENDVITITLSQDTEKSFKEWLKNDK